RGGRGLVRRIHTLRWRTRKLLGRRSIQPRHLLAAVAQSLVLLVVALFNGSMPPARVGAPELEVDFAGCDVMQLDDGSTVCNVIGASIFDGAANGPQPK